MITAATNPIGFTTQLHDQIEYAEEVRRKIIASDQHRQAVLVCLKAGDRLIRHTSMHDAFITVIEGQGLFILEGQEIGLEPGVFMTLPANATHTVNALSNLAFLKVVDSDNDCQEHPQPIDKSDSSQV